MRTERKKSYRYDPGSINLDLAIRRYFLGAYCYYILDDACMSDAEWDALGKRLQRDWTLVAENPRAKILERSRLNSAHYIPEHRYSLICAIAAYHIVGKDFVWSRLRRKRWNKKLR